MYFICEIQINAEGQGAYLMTIETSLDRAESKYYTILAAAAISGLPVHGAIVFDEKMNVLMLHSYDRRGL